MVRGNGSTDGALRGWRLAILLLGACSVDGAGIATTGQAGAAAGAGGAGATTGLAGAGGAAGDSDGGSGGAAAGSTGQAGAPTGLGGAGGPAPLAGAGGDAAPGGTGGAAASGEAGVGGAGMGVAGQGEAGTGVAGTGDGGGAGTGAAGAAGAGVGGIGGIGAGGGTGGGAAMGGDSGSGGRGGVGGGCGACPACMRCANGACSVDPASLWKVRCVRADIAQTKPGGDSWDQAIGSTAGPDPVCAFWVGNSLAAQTSILANTFAPAWNESITPSSRFTASLLSSQSNPWSIRVSDDDQLGADAICSVMPALDAGAFSSGGAFFATGSCTRLEIGLECASP